MILCLPPSYSKELLQHSSHTRHYPIQASLQLCTLCSRSYFLVRPSRSGFGTLLKSLTFDSELRHPLPTVMLHLHSALLLPLFHHLWKGQGSGNANFYYASTLVFGLANAAAIVDALRAGLKLGYGTRQGYELIQL